eukprot:786497-Pyramimonas_sp.AAC.1
MYIRALIRAATVAETESSKRESLTPPGGRTVARWTPSARVIRRGRVHTSTAVEWEDGPVRPDGGLRTSAADRVGLSQHPEPFDARLGLAEQQVSATPTRHPERSLLY